MERGPKSNILPMAIAGGAMLACCLGSALIVSGASGLIIAWLGGIDPLLAVGVAVAIFVLILLIRSMRKSASTKTQHTSPPAWKGDK